MEKVYSPAELGGLMREALELKDKQAAIKARLQEIAAVMDSVAVFREGSLTGHVAADGVACKVSRKRVVSWNQDKLREAAEMVDPGLFRKAFDWEIKPRSSRELQAWLSRAEVPNRARALVVGAREEKDGSPSVSYGYVED